MSFFTTALVMLGCATQYISAQNLGVFDVTVSTTELVDTSRTDPFANTTQPRALMVSVFQPISGQQDCLPIETSYMPPATASYEGARFAAYGLPDSVFANMTYTTCSAVQDEADGVEPPTILFSGALATSRYLYNLLAAGIAEYGYRVITVDHPYDTDIVEFTSGDIVLGLNLSDAQIPLAADTRGQDLAFVAQQFVKAEYRGPCLQVRRVVVLLGHSLGGAGALNALNSSPFAGAINLDGSVLGNVTETGTGKPVVFFSHTGKNITTDDTWEAIWPKFTGFKKQLELTGGSEHYTFSDLPMVAKGLGLTAHDLPEAIAEVIGTLNADRTMEIISAYVDDFFGSLLEGKNMSLLEGPSAAYPEVAFDA